MSQDPAPQIPPRLEDVLQHISDQGYAERLRKVYAAAAVAIGRLSDLDLVRYETSVAQETPDLSLWEEMAPVIRDTVMDVNALLTVIREQFPPTVAGGLHETVARAADEAGGHRATTPEARRAARVAEALRKAMAEIAQQITELGETMRSPGVVSDRWNLLAQIQKFRTLFRKEISGLVYDSASSFGDVSRRDVVPGYDEELTSAVAVRATIADLQRVLSSRREKAGEAEPEDVQWHARQLEKELDAFGRTAGYRGLRAQDKRAFLEHRAVIGAAAEDANVRRAQLIAAIDPLLELVRSLFQVNRREILVTHDHELLASCGVRIEQAQAMLPSNPEGAAHALVEAALKAQGLYGRDPDLDAFLRQARRTSLASLEGRALTEAIEQFRALLANLPVG